VSPAPTVGDRVWKIEEISALRIHTMGSREVVKTIPDADGSREVRIVRNSDGSFGFEEWRRSAYHSAIRGRGEFWEPISKGRTFADSPETAEREARAGVDWLIRQ
jgi:hypothetical protein